MTEEQLLIRERMLNDVEGIDPRILLLACTELEHIYEVPFAIRLINDELEVINLSEVKVTEGRDLAINPEGIYRGSEGISHLLKSEDYDSVKALTKVKIFSEFIEMQNEISKLMILNRELFELALVGVKVGTRDMDLAKNITRDKDALSKIFDSSIDADRDGDGVIDRLDNDPDKSNDLFRKDKAHRRDDLEL